MFHLSRPSSSIVHSTDTVKGPLLTFDFWLAQWFYFGTKKKNKKRNRNHRNVFSGRITLPGLWPVFTWPWRVNDSSSSRRGAGAFDLFVVLFPLVAVGRFFLGKIWRRFDGTVSVWEAEFEWGFALLTSDLPLSKYKLKLNQLKCIQV